MLPHIGNRRPTKPGIASSVLYQASQAKKKIRTKGLLRCLCESPLNACMCFLFLVLLASGGILYGFIINHMDDGTAVHSQDGGFWGRRTNTTLEPAGGRPTLKRQNAFRNTISGIVKPNGFEQGMGGKDDAGAPAGGDAVRGGEPEHAVEGGDEGRNGADERGGERVAEGEEGTGNDASSQQDFEGIAPADERGEAGRLAGGAGNEAGGENGGVKNSGDREEASRKGDQRPAAIETMRRGPEKRPVLDESQAKAFYVTGEGASVSVREDSESKESDVRANPENVLGKVFRGVAPDKKSLYEALAGASDLGHPTLFACDGGDTKIGAEKVNDDFCDCADGTDEPGTSACENGTFFCTRPGSVREVRVESIHSSRVNDGVCDCCDGSDEWNTPVSRCTNRC